MTGESSARVMLTGDNVVFTTHPKSTSIYERVADRMRDADIRFGNLEWPLADRGELHPLKAWNAGTGAPIAGMRMAPSAIDAMKSAGYDVMSLANNHHMDYGAAGSSQTMSLLGEAGVAHCGAGRNSAEALRAAIVERRGVRVAFLAVTSVFPPAYSAGPDRHGVAAVKINTTYAPPNRVSEQPGSPMGIITTPDRQQRDAVVQAIKDAKQQADAVIVSWHWGVSRDSAGPLYAKRVPYQMDMARLCVDSGASLVVGHHPHCLQGVELYKGGVICYSLGNFVFARGGHPPAGPEHQSVMADCRFTRQGLQELSFIPVITNENEQPEAVDMGRGLPIMSYLQYDSYELNATLIAQRDRIAVKR